MYSKQQVRVVCASPGASKSPQSVIYVSQGANNWPQPYVMRTRQTESKPCRRLGALGACAWQVAASSSSSSSNLSSGAPYIGIQIKHIIRAYWLSLYMCRCTYLVHSSLPTNDEQVESCYRFVLVCFALIGPFLVCFAPILLDSVSPFASSSCKLHIIITYNITAWWQELIGISIKHWNKKIIKYPTVYFA